LSFFLTFILQLEKAMIQNAMYITIAYPIAPHCRLRIAVISDPKKNTNDTIKPRKPTEGI